jgi:hypothetical protein
MAGKLEQSTKLFLQTRHYHRCILRDYFGIVCVMFCQIFMFASIHSIDYIRYKGFDWCLEQNGNDGWPCWNMHHVYVFNCSSLR